MIITAPTTANERYDSTQQVYYYKYLLLLDRVNTTHMHTREFISNDDVHYHCFHYLNQ